MVIAARPFLLHVETGSERPRTAAAARAIADRLLRALDARAVIPDVDRWFNEACRRHGAAIDARLAREREIGEPSRKRDAVQPGLFDRRAMAAAERAVALAAQVLDAHRLEIDALERSRTLRLACPVSGVLILWR
jgi:hypothetical protein